MTSRGTEDWFTHWTAPDDDDLPLLSARSSYRQYCNGVGLAVEDLNDWMEELRSMHAVIGGIGKTPHLLCRKVVVK
jgi:hypothetical protein